MKQSAIIFLLTLILVSCGTDSRHFKIDGRLIHLNQGEFYVYSPDGDMQGIDTIRVESGRFTYETPCTKPLTLVIIFPNYSEQPVFAQPGKTATVKGDASHLKEMTVTGTKDNELMNDFRQMVANASPPEAAKHAAQFIEDHPTSPVGGYLVAKYFMQTQQPDPEKATKLLKLMVAQQPENGYLKRLLRQEEPLASTGIGKRVPRFTATATNGQRISEATLSGSQGAIVCAFATWSYESVTTLRRLCEKKRNGELKQTLLGVCIDGSLADCRRTLKNNEIDCPVVCDGDMTEGKTYRTLGFVGIPDNIVVKGGVIKKAGLSQEDLVKE